MSIYFDNALRTQFIDVHQGLGLLHSLLGYALLIKQVWVRIP